jgi:hypothetical protein
MFFLCVWSKQVRLACAGKPWYSAILSVVDEAKRDRIVAAQHEWRAAVMAYAAEADKYFSDGFLDRGETGQPAEALTTA